MIAEYLTTRYGLPGWLAYGGVALVQCLILLGIMMFAAAFSRSMIPHTPLT